MCMHTSLILMRQFKLTPDSRDGRKHIDCGV